MLLPFHIMNVSLNLKSFKRFGKKRIDRENLGDNWLEIGEWLENGSFYGWYAL